MTWPTDRPGYPMHAERDGWHWLKHPEDLRPFPSAWNAELRGWPSGALHSPQGIVDLGFAYLGPCYTQADLDAAVQGEREACIGAVMGTMKFGTRKAVSDATAAIRALPLPTPDALAEMLAQARREGMEKAARIAHAAHGVKGAPALVLCAAALRARAAEAGE